MLPVLQGTIVRRVLMNFRADPVIARRLVPKPFEIVTQNGSAVVGVCLIRLEHLRPKGLPASVGLSSENMAHRIAVRFPSATGWRPGVFIWRRETNQRLTALLGGRLFPGVHGHARFHALESEEELSLEVFTKRKEADVTFRGSRVSKWKQTGLFDTLATVSAFFAQGDCGFSRSRHGTYEGMRLRMLEWRMTPLEVREARSNFFEDEKNFPPGSVKFDGAVLMAGIPHEWVELPNLAVLDRPAGIGLKMEVGNA